MPTLALGLLCSNHLEHLQERQQMTTSVIRIPADLDAKLQNMQIFVPKEQNRKTNNGTGLVKPQGPKCAPKSKTKKGETGYTDEFVEQCVSWLYDDLLTLRQISEILNSYNLKTSRGLEWNPGRLNAALDTNKAWTLIEPRWIQWQIDNFEVFA